MLENFQAFEIQNPKIIYGGIHSITAEVTVNKAKDD